MALPPLPGQIDERVRMVRVMDPQSITFKFSELVGVDGFYAGNVKTVAIFNPQKTYVVFSLRYSVLAFGGNLYVDNFFQVGFTPIAAGIGASSALGTSMLDLVVTAGPAYVPQEGSVNFVPYAWYLPVGKQVYLSATTSIDASYFGMNIGAKGVIQLYISETFEQG